MGDDPFDVLEDFLMLTGEEHPIDLPADDNVRVLAGGRSVTVASLRCRRAGDDIGLASFVEYDL